jgi:small subunit ribosomal protein S17
MASVQPTARQLTGVVVTAGKMMKTVKVQVPKQKWNKRIQKVCNF